MRIALSAPLALLGAFLVSATPIERSSSSLEARQTTGPVTVDNALANMLANIGGMSSATKVAGVLDGTVIAAPSRSNPDYYYSWLRDSALTWKVLIDGFNKGKFGITRAMVQRWITSEITNQKAALASSSGLGEPKFNADGSLFTGPWGRPQNDGPAIRATAIMAFARKIGLSDPYVTGTLYKSDLSANSIIKADLEYVAHNWQNSNFDLWEEVNADHFFTLAVQRRALVEGAEFATALKDTGAATYYYQQANAIASKLATFWSSSLNRVQAYQNYGSRNGIDSAVLLGAVHGWNQSSTATGKSDTLFGPASPRVLATLRQYVDSFRSLYPINNNAAAPAAVLTGRYPSDIYDGVGTSQGNPWFLTTLNAAEVLYDAVSIFRKDASITVTSVSLSFFQQFLPSVATGTYASTSSTFTTLINGMLAQADGFVAKIQSHANQSGGNMAEEMNRSTGFQQGAPDLTWSYAAFITAIQAKQGTPCF